MVYCPLFQIQFLPPFFVSFALTVKPGRSIPFLHVPQIQCGPVPRHTFLYHMILSSIAMSGSLPPPPQFPQLLGAPRLARSRSFSRGNFGHLARSLFSKIHPPPFPFARQSLMRSIPSHVDFWRSGHGVFHFPQIRPPPLQVSTHPRLKISQLFCIPS